ncbi:MAG: helicase-related protein [Myxococcota bacterium]|jgi:RNA helicase HrpA|nr:helicase-related protein [Myxococcota bacterium]
MTSPAELPIHQHRQELIDAFSKHRVVVVEGPTGCGKTTQLPRILLDAGLVQGRIGVTQPRRIAAVSVAHRLAQELDCTLGQEVGYAIRFDDHCSSRTVIKIMTDGILLQESRLDPNFEQYAVVVVDEAHERSLNIDTTLGLLHQALARRPDLKVVISSATLRAEHFQRFFQPVAGRVPLVSIKAKLYPVELVYRAPKPHDHDALVNALVDEVLAIDRSDEPGHILAFLTGEGMIKECSQLITERRPRNLQVLPLYGALTREEQERVFQEFGKRKVILATNIAETSITIADVRFIIDTGLAKLPRFDQRTGITSLREEPISQASLAQRAGRAGRTAAGKAIRLFDERYLRNRPDFTEEEILRLELSEVVLRLIDLGVRDVEQFPFPTPPPRRSVRRALWQLHLLGAIDEAQELTEIGRRMVPFPLGPSLARMVVEASRLNPSLLDDVIIAGAFLSVRSPYVYPAGEESAARRVHLELAQRLGDAATAIHVFKRYEKAKQPELLCKQLFLEPNTMAFVASARQQLADIAKQEGMSVQTGADPKLINRAVAAGFPNHFLQRKGHAYLTAAGDEVFVHPSSSLYGTRHRFLLAAELVRSRRTYAHHVCVVEPDWIRELNPDLARQWGLGVAKAPTSGAGVEASTLRVGSLSLRVLSRAGRKKVIVPRDAIPELIRLGPAAVPQHARSWEASLRDEQSRYLSDVPLGVLVALLPVLPLPEQNVVAADEVPQGALLDPERNLHTIERYLHLLLEPAYPLRGRQPGWLSLVWNGAEGFWFEASTDFAGVAENTSEALEALLETYPEGDEMREAVVEMLAVAREKRDAVRDAARWAR